MVEGGNGETLKLMGSNIMRNERREIRGSKTINVKAMSLFVLDVRVQRQSMEGRFCKVI